MNTKINHTVRNCFRAVIKFFCFYGIFSAVNTLFLRFTEQFNEENREGWSLAIMIFVMVSVSWVFYHFNKRAGTYFLETCASSENAKKKISPIHTLQSLDFCSNLFVSCILSFISPFIIPYSDIERLFFKNASINPIVQKLLIGIFISTMFFFVEWFTIFDIRKKWARHKDISSKNELLMIPAYLGFITIIYSVGFYIAMAYVPGLAVYAFLFKELIFEILIAITIILLLICFNRIQKRAKFIRKLKKASSESDYELSKIEKPYLSIFKKTAGASFTIKAHGKNYQCKLISGKRKGIPIIFTDQGFLLYKRIVRIGKSELFSIYSKYNYSFQSDVKKCLILTCIPTQCYFKDSSGYMRKIDTGEKIGEYTIYSSQGFLGALDRNCLDR